MLMIYKLGGAGIVSGGRIMAEKRFEYKNHKVFDNLTGETHSSNMVSVNVLNALHEENQALKQKNDELIEEIARQKFTKKMMRENIQDYEKSIKRLRKSFEEFDKMRIKRIQFLEHRLKKNGLSIYINTAGDVE